MIILLQIERPLLRRASVTLLSFGTSEARPLENASLVYLLQGLITMGIQSCQALGEDCGKDIAYDAGTTSP